MALLLANPSYILAAEFKTLPLDYDLSSYTDSQLQDLLNRASGDADAIMRRSLLAQERTDVFYGQGSNIMSLRLRPLIYVKQMQFVQPGIVGFTIPPNRVLIDYLKGQIVQYSPLELQGVGFVSVFPDGLPIAITFAWGYGFNPCTPPKWVASDAPAGSSGLTPGPYVIGITTKTQWGETLPNVQGYTTVTGNIIATVTPVLGVWKYRYFIAAGQLTTLTAPVVAGATSIPVVAATGYTVGESIVLDPNNALAEAVKISGIVGTTFTTSPTANAHASGATVSPLLNYVGEIPATTFGGEATVGTIGSLTPPASSYPETQPLVDTSDLELPEELREGTRLLAMQILYEQNNLANRGVAKTESGRKATMYRPTTGVGGRGVPTYWMQAEEVLKPLKYMSIS